MKQMNWKHTARVFLSCVIVAVMMAGCSSSKGIFGYLKFWGPMDEKAAEENTAAQASAFMSKTRTARGNPDSHYWLGVHYQKQGRYQEAIQEFKKTIAIDPEHVNAYNGLGVAYDNLKEKDHARHAYRAALKIDPGDRHAYNNLGYSFILEGDYESAVEILLEGLSIDENNGHMRNNLAMAYVGLGERNLARAEIQQVNRPDKVQSAFESIQKKLNQLEIEKASSMMAQKGISSEDIAPVLAKNRFTERISRSLARAKRVKARSITGPVDLKSRRLEPGYLMIAKTENQDHSLQSSDRSVRFIREIMKTRTTEDTDIIDSLSRRQTWF